MATNETRVSVGGFWIGLAILLVFFWGEPDLCDALIARLMHPNESTYIVDFRSGDEEQEAHHGDE